MKGAGLLRSPLTPVMTFAKDTAAVRQNNAIRFNDVLLFIVYAIASEIAR